MAMALDISDHREHWILVVSSNVGNRQSPVDFYGTCVINGSDLEVTITSPDDGAQIIAVLTKGDMDGLATETVVPIVATTGSLQGNKVQAHLSVYGDLIITIQSDDLYTDKTPTLRTRLPDSVVQFIRSRC